MGACRTAVALALALALSVLAAACTQEQQNQFRRDIQNWTGTNGVLEVYAGEKRVYFEISDYATNYVFFENPH